MPKKPTMIRQLLFTLPLLAIVSCSFNPLSANNHTTGNPGGAFVGAAAGAGGAALLGGSKPLIALAGIGGGMIGYYVTTLRSDAAGIVSVGGQAYQVGDFVGIDVPSDQLFEPNTADFLPQATPILESIATTLDRYPDHSILISGNTSGFGRAQWEQKLSEERAKRVAAYLWSVGISPFKKNSIDLRKLNYVGYGNYFPIANNDSNDSLRQNSRIQITLYPSGCEYDIDKKRCRVSNIGAMDDEG